MAVNIGIPLIYGSSFNFFVNLNLTLQPLSIRLGSALSILALMKIVKKRIDLLSICNNHSMISLSFFNKTRDLIHSMKLLFLKAVVFHP